MQAAMQSGHTPLSKSGYDSLPVRAVRVSGRVERAGAHAQSRDSMFAGRATSVIGAAAIEPFTFVAVVHSPADADYANIIAARLADVARVMPVPVSANAATSLGSRVAAVVIWSAAAAHAGLSDVMARYAAPGRAVLTLVRDGAPPAALRAVQVQASHERDPVVDAGVVRDALLTWKNSLEAAAGEAPPQKVVSTTGEDESVVGFTRGLAASVAAMSLAGVGGYVLLPALAAQDGALAAGTAPIAATAVAENSFAAQPAVTVQYGADAYVSARFGGELRVAFLGSPVVSSGQAMAETVEEPVAVTMADASLPSAPVLRGSFPVVGASSGPAAPPLVAVDADAAPTPVFSGPAPITAIEADTSMTVFGALTGGPLGIAPSFITDTPADEPQIY